MLPITNILSDHFVIHITISINNVHVPKRFTDIHHLLILMISFLILDHQYVLIIYAIIA